MAERHDIEQASRILSIDLTNDDLLLEALQAAGSGRIVSGRLLPEGNKRLARLGEAVTRLVLLQDWYASAGDRGMALSPDSDKPDVVKLQQTD